MNHPPQTPWQLRLATPSDIPALRTLIAESALQLQRDIYTRDQILSAIGPVFGVDEQMIADNTYFVISADSTIVGCGGWSFREALFGGRTNADPQPLLNPNTDAARIRAFFVHPSFARQGIGSTIMHACEKAVIAHGFHHGEISATLVGEPLYQKFGYITTDYYQIPLPSGESITAARMTKTYPNSIINNPPPN